ncbi:MAG: transposase [Acidimicrobiales bacterium]
MCDRAVCFGGVDWAKDTHAVVVVEEQGDLVDELEVDNTTAGLSELCRRMHKHRARRVDLECPDRPVVDALLEAGLEVVVVSSRSVRTLLERYRLAGNKSHRSDAYVLADCLRADGHRRRAPEPDSPEIGGRRAPFPDAESLARLSGVVPSASRSRRCHAVTFRWSADKQLRGALCDFAGDCWQANARAEQRCRAPRAAGKRHQHAERILARSWTHDF